MKAQPADMSRLSRASSVVDIKDLSVQFGGADGVLALHDVSLVVGEGEFVSLIGPSGCGKTTLLRSIAGLVRPTQGEVRVSGKAVDEARRDREIGFVFQQPALLEWRNAIKNIELPLEIQGLPHEEARTRGEEALALVDLEDAARRYPRELSGGMQQRVSIARALVTEPRVLLMDEPFGALDAITRDRLNLELLRVFDRAPVSIVFVTHSIQEAVFLSDRVFVMSPGPGTILRILEIPIPRPRHINARELPAFGELVSEGLRLLVRGFEKEES